ncbi:hypothetical protein Leryth_011690 [Lithospermum erythrorhizon]|nr:hypothetical protein Leryth_011690 [Lithospermum erythrorhizon]
MAELPSLCALCLDVVKDQLLHDSDIIHEVYSFPPELFNCLLPRLSPLALQKLEDQMPDDFVSDCEPVTDKRKRKRNSIFDQSWRTLYMCRWPCLDSTTHGEEDKHKYESVDDWQQFYWESHIQSCLDAAAEISLLPSYSDRVSVRDLEIPDIILKYLFGKGHALDFMNDCKKLSWHCHKFGLYARSLRLRNVMCVAEICDLLRNSKLETLELRWMKAQEHVQGLCKLLFQINGSLTSIKFMHCKLSSGFVNSICNSLFIDSKTHGLQHFSITASSILEKDSSIPLGFTSFLSSGRLVDVRLVDVGLRPNSARSIFSALIDASLVVSVLDLSDNNISGCFSNLRWIRGSFEDSSFGLGKSLQCLRILNLRNCNLQVSDANALKYALIHMPILEAIDLSDNPIEDEGIMSLFFFIKMSEQQFHLVDLKLANCELTCFGVNQLLGVLSTTIKPLNSLSIGGNDLGKNVGAPLGRLLCTGIKFLDLEDIGLGSPGFLDAKEEIKKTLEVVHINISKNRGGIGVAEFLSKLIKNAPSLISIDAGYNFMPVEAVPVISSCLKSVQGNLQHLDLTGHNFGGMSVLPEFHIKGKLVVKYDSSPPLNAPYDDEP